MRGSKDISKIFREIQHLEQKAAEELKEDTISTPLQIINVTHI